jgi:hypothetical protein
MTLLQVRNHSIIAAINFTYTPMIITVMEIRRAQSLPTRDARVPPTKSCARPGGISVFWNRHLDDVGDVPVEAHGIVAITYSIVSGSIDFGFSGKSTNPASGSINIVVVLELFIGEDHRL